MAAGPLQGVRVIDLTIWMSGAIGAMLLGDLGADVIKVEGPTGDPVRRYVPIGATDPASAPGGVNYAYALCNRNKRHYCSSSTNYYYGTGRYFWTTRCARSSRTNR